MTLRENGFILVKFFYAPTKMLQFAQFSMGIPRPPKNHLRPQKMSISAQITIAICVFGRSVFDVLILLDSWGGGVLWILCQNSIEI